MPTQRAAQLGASSAVPTTGYTTPQEPQANENLWHREWMERTENAYEWWYFDSVSDNGEWSLVVIFLLGSPFSPYARECELGLNPDPVKHNGVFVALHHRGRLQHYLYARYPSDRITAGDTSHAAALSLQFGPNSWQSEDAGVYVIRLDEENANRRRIVARLSFSEASARTGGLEQPLDVQSDSGHRWLPVIVGGLAQCEVELHSPGEAREPERVSFRGSAYHDHNWGALPFGKTIRQWLWARADFSPGCAAVVYQTIPVSNQDSIKTILLTRRPHEPVAVYNDVEARVERSARNGYGVAYPREVTARYDGGLLSWKFGRSLESTPFYMRCESAATWRETGSNNLERLRSGRGIAEMLRPRGMGAWLIAHAMRLRIHEPGI